MYDAYVCLRDLKPQNTNGGTFTSAAWRTRDLTEKQADPDEICTLEANQFTLPAGSYRSFISCPAFMVNYHQARLYDVTDAATLLLGTSEFTSTATAVVNHSHMTGRFTLTAQHTLEVQHRCSASCDNNGFGRKCNFTDELYTLAEFWREIEPE